MTITIPPQFEAQVRDKARAAGVTVEAYIEQLIREDEEWTEESDFAEIQAAVREGLAQAERGEGRPAENVFADMRAKHGISR